MTDATTEFLARFSDPEAWDRKLEGVPIFVGHSTVGSDGKPYTVDKARLGRIAAKMRQRQDKSGVLLKLTDGHTKLVAGADGKKRYAPQGEQPAILSYGKDPRLGMWTPDPTRPDIQEPAILVDEYVCRGAGPVRRQRPFRSPEFIEEDDEIDAVALLTTKPRLDMGVVTYATRTDPDKYVFYMQEPTMDPAAPPDAKAPDDEFMGKCDQYMSTKYPHLPAMHQAYAATQTPDVPPAAPPPVAPPVPPPVKAPDKAPDLMASDKIAQQYAADLAKANRSLEALTKKLRVTEYSAELKPLAEHYGFDLAEEVATVQDLDRAGFDKHKARLKKGFEAYAAKLGDPANPRYDVDLPGVGGDSKPAAGDSFGKAQLTRANHYMEETHKPGMDWEEVWEQAEAYAVSAAKSPAAYRASQKAGK